MRYVTREVYTERIRVSTWNSSRMSETRAGKHTLTRTHTRPKQVHTEYIRARKYDINAGFRANHNIYIVCVIDSFSRFNLPIFHLCHFDHHQNPKISTDDVLLRLMLMMRWLLFISSPYVFALTSVEIYFYILHASELASEHNAICFANLSSVRFVIFVRFRLLL